MNGDYADIFEKAYQEEVSLRMAKMPADDPYHQYLTSIRAQNTHNGYFSVDKNRHMVDPKVKNVKR